MGRREKDLIIPPRKAKEFTSEEVKEYRIMFYGDTSQNLISDNLIRRVMEEYEILINSKEDQVKRAQVLADLKNMFDSRI